MDPNIPLTDTAKDILSSVVELPVSPTKQYVVAPILYRAFAYVIDVCILLPFYLIFLAILFTTPVHPEERVVVFFFVGMIAVILFIISIGYFVYFESHGGKTAGKKLFHLQVLKGDNTPCTWKSAFIRAFFRFVDILLWLAVFLSPKRMRIGDRAANTWVVRD